jgi:hypothetical protein
MRQRAIMIGILIRPREPIARVFDAALNLLGSRATSIDDLRDPRHLNNRRIATIIVFLTQKTWHV